MGPPYMLVKDDFRRLARTWVSFVPKVYEDFPDLLAEMYAYSMAAAHEQLPHLRMDHFMVSNIDVDVGEGVFYNLTTITMHMCGIRKIYLVSVCVWQGGGG